jgi:hypothetical protein
VEKCFLKNFLTRLPIVCISSPTTFRILKSTETVLTGRLFSGVTLTIFPGDKKMVAKIESLVFTEVKLGFFVLVGKKRKPKKISDTFPRFQWNKKHNWNLKVRPNCFLALIAIQ